jgi:hypothetical protein
MNVWWPWRKKKQPLSLFDPPYGHDPDELLIESPPEWARSSEPHARNAPGPFYVANTECMACGYPHVLAPDLMGWSEDGHCYFKKQPATAAEEEQAVKAVAGSCCGQLRYVGADAKVIKKLQQHGSKAIGNK